MAARENSKPSVPAIDMPMLRVSTASGPLLTEPTEIDDADEGERTAIVAPKCSPRGYEILTKAGCARSLASGFWGQTVELRGAP